MASVTGRNNDVSSIGQDESRASVSTSTEVRDFYERMPYPAPLTSLDEHRELYRDPARRHALFHLLWPGEPLRRHQEILIAGCGTSQAARYAMREPDARVTAIDVSDTSLHCTRDLQQKYGLQNLELRQLPIERVHELGRTFDQVVCTGVLHHLPDPDLGLRALRNVLRPDGALHVMVYAAYGRAGIYMMQEYCRLLGIDSSDANLHQLADTLGSLPADHPIAGAMRGAWDFRHPDALADALLHPLDRAFTVPEIYAWLERCGLTFGRWYYQAPYLPQCGMLATSPHAARLTALPPPLQHAAVELFRGTMIRHDLIGWRDDRVTTSSATPTGDRWHSYVPIRLPSTICVRERAPSGAVAVLINRAHTFHDLVLTVDAVEDQWFRAIDGQRTIAEILAAAPRDGRDQIRALSFFERLWHYDQVVFDASA